MRLSLNDVPWDTLEHAYGSAADVPEQLSRLLSPDKATYEEALGRFWGNIIHQGTVYEATSYVVPFLIALLESSEVVCKAGIMGLLSGIADGTSYHVAHADIDRAMGTADVGSLEWQQIAQKELGWVGAAYLAATSGIPVYLTLLQNDPSLEVRAAATYVLGNFPGNRNEIISDLLEDILAETTAEVQASRLLAAAHLAQSQVSDGEREDPALTLIVTNAASALLTMPEGTLGRVAAALTLVRLLGPKAPDTAVSVLLESLKNPEAVNDAFLSIPWSGDRSIVSTVSSFLGSLLQRSHANAAPPPAGQYATGTGLENSL